MLSRRLCLAAIVVLSGWASSVSATLLPAVVVNEQEWLQPLDFVSLSWNTISTVCDPESGACNGTLGGHDVSGWTWAGLNAVFAMTSAFTGAPPGDIAAGLNSAWAPLFLESFAANDVDPGRSMVNGFVRERQVLSDGTVFYGLVYVADAHRPPFVDSVAAIPTISTTGQQNIGAWLYRETANAVPAPPSLALFALSLALLRLNFRIK